MERWKFERLVRETLDTLPRKYRIRVKNVVVMVRDLPRGQRRRLRPKSGDPPRPRHRPVLMGEYIGVPQTERSVFDLVTGPDMIVLYQKNIERACRTEKEIREQVTLTVMHELGHYFGMDEDQLSDV